MKIETPIAGVLGLQPSATVAAEPIRTVQGMAAFCMLPLETAARAIVIPGSNAPNGQGPKFVTEDGWNRDLGNAHHLALGLDAPPPLPLLVSSGSAWVITEKRIDIYRPAHLVDGAVRFLAWLRIRFTAIPVIVLPSLTRDEARAFRATFAAADMPVARGPTNAVFAQACGLPRCHVKDTKWRELRCESEPFIVPNAMGYGVAIIVVELPGTRESLLYINAKSLAAEFERYRFQQGHLKGAEVRIRKTGESSTAPYETEFRQEGR